MLKKISNLFSKKPKPTLTRYERIVKRFWYAGQALFAIQLLAVVFVQGNSALMPIKYVPLYLGGATFLLLALTFIAKHLVNYWDTRVVGLRFDGNQTILSKPSRSRFLRPKFFNRLNYSTSPLAESLANGTKKLVLTSKADGLYVEGVIFRADGGGDGTYGNFENLTRRTPEFLCKKTVEIIHRNESLKAVHAPYVFATLIQNEDVDESVLVEYVLMAEKLGASLERTYRCRFLSAAEFEEFIDIPSFLLVELNG